MKREKHDKTSAAKTKEKKGGKMEDSDKIRMEKGLEKERGGYWPMISTMPAAWPPERQ